jgi:hypothetical protein
MAATPADRFTSYIMKNQCRCCGTEGIIGRSSCVKQFNWLRSFEIWVEGIDGGLGHG